MVIFNPKIYVADLGNFKQDFLSMKLIQKSNFRVQGMFFSSTIVLRKIKTRHTLKKALVVIPVLKGRVTLPNRMNYRKGSKRQLTPTPNLSEWSLSLEIMYMHFILSGPRTSLSDRQSKPRKYVEPGSEKE